MLKLIILKDKVLTVSKLKDQNININKNIKKKTKIKTLACTKRLEEKDEWRDVIDFIMIDNSKRNKNPLKKQYKKAVIQAASIHHHLKIIFLQRLINE